MWCGTFEYQDDREQQFRINQMIQVLIKMKEQLKTMEPKHKYIKVLSGLLFQIIKTTYTYSK